MKEVVSNAIDALRAHPMALSVLLFNALILFTVLWGVRSTTANQHDIMKQLLVALTTCSAGRT